MNRQPPFEHGFLHKRVLLKVLELQADIFLDIEFHAGVVVELKLGIDQPLVDPLLGLAGVDQPDRDVLVVATDVVQCLDPAAAVVAADDDVGNLEMIDGKLEDR